MSHRETARSSPGAGQVDPRAPRFGQAVAATLALLGVGLQSPALVYGLTVLLVVAVVSRWRIDPYAVLWRSEVRRVVGPPAGTGSALPHRFARVVGAIVTAIASVLLLAAGVTGIPILALAGYGFAAVTGALAALSATTGFCLGCRMYSQVSLFRRLGLLSDPRERTA